MDLKFVNFLNNHLAIQLNVTIIDNKEYFVGKDVATLLGYKDPSAAVRDNVWDSNKTKMFVENIEVWNGSNTHSQKVHNNLVLLNEAGLYQLVFASKLPAAQSFQHWVFNVVLPSIRANGGYIYGETHSEIETNAKRAMEASIKSLLTGLEMVSSISSSRGKTINNLSDKLDIAMDKFNRLLLTSLDLRLYIIQMYIERNGLDVDLRTADATTIENLFDQVVIVMPGLRNVWNNVIAICKE